MNKKTKENIAKSVDRFNRQNSIVPRWEKCLSSEYWGNNLIEMWQEKGGAYYLIMFYGSGGGYSLYRQEL